MKTLVIHPDDRSTDFLRPIYKHVANLTLITGEATRDEILDHIEINDRVFMMGHGSPMGLFGYNFGRPYVIYSDCVEALRKKEHNVMYIWCHANQFVDHYDLKGMYSGMFISEVAEANFCGVKDATQELVTASNDWFANACGNCINESIESVYNQVKDSYSVEAKYNPVAAYNHPLLCFR